MRARPLTASMSTLAGFDVPVNQSGQVRGGQPTGDVPGCLNCLISRNRVCDGKVLIQRLPVNVLHHDIRKIPIVNDLVNVDDGGMRNRCPRPELLDENDRAPSGQPAMRARES